MNKSLHVPDVSASALLVLDMLNGSSGLQNMNYQEIMPTIHPRLDTMPLGSRVSATPFNQRYRRIKTLVQHSNATHRRPES